MIGSFTCEQGSTVSLSFYTPDNIPNREQRVYITFLISIYDPDGIMIHSCHIFVKYLKPYNSEIYTIKSITNLEEAKLTQNTNIFTITFTKKNEYFENYSMCFRIEEQLVGSLNLNYFLMLYLYEESKFNNTEIITNDKIGRMNVAGIVNAKFI